MTVINKMKLAQGFQPTDLEAARQFILEVAQQRQEKESLKAEIKDEILNQISIQVYDEATPIIKELKKQLENL